MLIKKKFNSIEQTLLKDDWVWCKFADARIIQYKMMQVDYELIKIPHTLYITYDKVTQVNITCIIFDII